VDVPAYPSIAVVRAELDIEMTGVERRASNVDTKAGQVLGFAGVLVGLAIKSVSSWIQAVGLVFAVLAGLVAIWVFLPRSASSISPRALRDGYLTTSEEQTRLVVLDTRIGLHKKDEEDLRKKRNRLFAAVLALFVAIVLVAAGPIMDLVKGGQHVGTASNGGAAGTSVRPSISTRPSSGGPTRR
jgi:hypothetical protein